MSPAAFEMSAATHSATLRLATTPRGRIPYQEAKTVGGLQYSVKYAGALFDSRYSSNCPETA